MNCKPGDLAVIVRSDDPRNVGIVCEVIERSEVYDFEMLAEPYWVVRSLGRPFHVEFRHWGEPVEHGVDLECDTGDSELRPIRDQPGEDETLTWAGKPEQVTA